jgi:hypothetical protein
MIHYLLGWHLLPWAADPASRNHRGPEVPNFKSYKMHDYTLVIDHRNYVFFTSTDLGGDMMAGLKTVVIVLVLIIAEYHMCIVQIGLFQRRLEVVLRLRTLFAVCFIVHFRPIRPASLIAVVVITILPSAGPSKF